MKDHQIAKLTNDVRDSLRKAYGDLIPMSLREVLSRSIRTSLEDMGEREDYKPEEL